MATTISRGVHDCLAAFRSFLALRDGEWEDNSGIHVENDFARFKVWAGNIGAHKKGQSSMEYRLRDASHIQKEVLRLLGQLGELLKEACTIVKGERVPWDKLPEDDDDDDSDEEGLDEFDYEFDYDRDDNSLENTPAEINDDEDNDGFPSTEMEQIVRNVGDIISCLLRLSVAIRNPAPHDRFRAAYETDTSSYEPFDILHVHDKFSGMDKIIIERLGRAISLRRQYFKYREAHHMKLAEGLEALGALERLDLEPARTEVLPTTLASSIPDAVKQDISFDLQTAAVNEDEASVTGASQTSFATSLSAEDKLSIPPLPVEAQYGPFECPFCFMMISATTRRAWKKHVFRDLRPYICLYRDCEMPNQDFGRRHEWIAHVTQYHWKTWTCPTAGCSETFNSAAGCEIHVTSVHPGAFQPSQLPYAVRFGERPLHPEQNEQCPFCNAALASVKEYHKHVARHQEQLALFALPNKNIPEKTDEEHDEDDTDSDDSLELNLDDRGSTGELEKLVETRVAELGPDHISTLDAVNNLGSLYINQGRLPEAEAMFRRALQGYEKALGPDHTSTLNTVNNLSSLYINQGRLPEAEAMFQRALQGYEKALGPDHTSTLNAVNSLNNLYRNQGRLPEAEAMLQRALQGKEKALGPDHISTLNTVNNLNSLYINQGRLPEAEAMFQRALQGYEKALGPDHTSTLNTVNNLGSLYINQGRLPEAEAMFQRALQGYEKALGPDHISTLDAVNNLGSLYINQGRLPEAETMLQRALQGKEKALGPDHISTLTTVNILRSLYSDQGRLPEAEAMYQWALQGKEKALSKGK